MADLTAAKRKKMPQREFAAKDKGFPINDAEHARLAIGGATRSERAGNISASEAAVIKAKARKKLGRPAYKDVSDAMDKHMGGKS